MQPGDRVTIAKQDIAFLGMHESVRSNYIVNTGVFTVDGDYMTPEKRWYPMQQKMTSEVALRLNGFGLLYLVMGDQDKDNPDRWVVRVYNHPLVLWIVLGALMMTGGGVFAFADRRRHA